MNIENMEEMEKEYMYIVSKIIQPKNSYIDERIEF